MTDADRVRGAGVGVQPARRALRGPVRLGRNHPHVVCRRCGAVADVDCAAGHDPCPETASIAGFTVDSAEVTFWGLCPGCQAPDGPPRS